MKGSLRRTDRALLAGLIGVICFWPLPGQVEPIAGRTRALPGETQSPSDQTQALAGQAQPFATARAVGERIAMVRIPAGSFMMGVDRGDSDAFQSIHPRRRVHVAALALSRYPITFDQYDAFARATGRPLPDDMCWGRGDRPVINVSFEDVRAFIRWLNRSGRRFRLPTEAEYEYAARAGTGTKYWWGDRPDPARANTALDRGPDIWPHTSPVGRFPANPFGLYDIVGNVWEWTSDCRYRVSTSPGGRVQCGDYVIRGGAWDSLTRGVRTTTRAAAAPATRSEALGFRLAEELPSS